MRRGPLSIILLLFLCSATESWAAGDAARAGLVVLVQSYNPEYTWCRHIEDGVRMAFRGLSVNLRSVYLDAKRDPNPERLRRRADEIAERLRAQRPAVVIAADDAAQRYLAVPLLKRPGGPQVIFCGVNATPARYGYPMANVSGVRERWHFRQGFALLRRIAPKTRTVALLTDDSESSGYVLRDLREEIKTGGLALRLTRVKRLRTFGEWRAAALAAQNSTDALAIGTYFSLVDEATGKVATPEQVAAWNQRHIRKPTLGFADYARDDGTLCGIIESGEEQGFLAGEMARGLMEHGGNAGALPLRVNKKGLVLLNLRTAQRLGLLIPYEIIKAGGVVIQ